MRMLENVGRLDVMGLLLRLIRLRAGLSVEVAATRVDKGHRSLRRFESGLTEIKISNIMEILDVYKLNMVDFWQMYYLLIEEMEGHVKLIDSCDPVLGQTPYFQSLLGNGDKIPKTMTMINEKVKVMVK